MFSIAFYKVNILTFSIAFYKVYILMFSIAFYKVNILIFSIALNHICYELNYTYILNTNIFYKFLRKMLLLRKECFPYQWNGVVE